MITIHPATVVDAGMDQAACAADTPEFQLAGSVSGTVTTGTWNDGGAMGTFCLTPIRLMLFMFLLYQLMELP